VFLDAAPLAVVALLLAVVLRFCALHLTNRDTWFHLVIGDRFRHGWRLGDPGGLTPFATSPWVPTQWSTEVVASQVESRLGLPGVAWMFGALFLAAVLGTYWSCRRRARAAAAAVVTTLVVLGLAPALSARPQVVSVVLLTVTVSAWLATARDGRVRWWLVPMTWVWAGAHGLWSAGVLLGAVCCVGLWLDGRSLGRRPLLPFTVPVLSVLAAGLTPVGPRLLTSQLAVSARASLIGEWGPTNLRTVPALAVAVMLAATVALWVRQGQTSWTRLGLLLLAAGWTLLVSRLVALGAVVTAPLLAEAWERALTGASVPAPVRPPTSGPLPVPRRERAALGVLALTYLLALGLAVPHTATAPGDVPSRLVPRLEALPSGSTLLVADGIGGWVEWRVPGVAPVIDGMLDAYPVPYISSFFAATRVEPGWEGFVRRSGAHVAVVPARSPLAAALVGQLGWRRVDGDRGFVYLVARTGPTPAAEVPGQRTRR
jgi:hypothetical protein